MEELYKKVFIKSEEDLPKVDGDYIVHSKAYVWIGIANWKAFENYNYPEYNQYLWLLNYDWYLQLVAQSKQEEPEKWNDDKVIDFINWYINLHKIDERFELENQNIIDSFLNGDDYKLWWDKVGQESADNVKGEKSITDNELINKLISEIPINQANLAYIIQHGEINGTLLVGIRHAMQQFAKEYAAQSRPEKDEIMCENCGKYHDYTSDECYVKIGSAT
jgi:hypothetical protein